jgi:hypothetical protein
MCTERSIDALHYGREPIGQRNDRVLGLAAGSLDLSRPDRQEAHDSIGGSGSGCL